MWCDNKRYNISVSKYYPNFTPLVDLFSRVFWQVFATILVNHFEVWRGDFFQRIFPTLGSFWRG